LNLRNVGGNAVVLTSVCVDKIATSTSSHDSDSV
jgi:hypothetical protein